jgi:predicted Holliday junction resolvase-like endonuclease
MDALTIVFTIIYFIIYHLRNLVYLLIIKIEEIKNDIELNEAIRNNELASLRQDRIENYREIRELYYTKFNLED